MTTLTEQIAAAEREVSEATVRAKEYDDKYNATHAVYSMDLNIGKVGKRMLYVELVDIRKASEHFDWILEVKEDKLAALREEELPRAQVVTEADPKLIVSGLIGNDYTSCEDYLKVLDNATYKLEREYTSHRVCYDSFGEWIDEVRHQQGKLYIEWYTNNDIVDTWKDYMLSKPECDSWSNDAGGA